MDDYSKPMTPEDRAAVARLCIYHPELLNPKYFEVYPAEEEE